MFGLSTREKLFQLILNTSENLLPNYLNYWKNNWTALQNASENEAAIIHRNVTREYLNDVSRAIFEFFSNSSPRVHMHLQFLMARPIICGMTEEIDIYDGITSGVLYGMCYQAVTRKPAKTLDCSKLSHMQMAIMTQAFENEFGGN